MATEPIFYRDDVINFDDFNPADSAASTTASRSWGDSPIDKFVLNLSMRLVFAAGILLLLAYVVWRMNYKVIETISVKAQGRAKLQVPPSPPLPPYNSVPATAPQDVATCLATEAKQKASGSAQRSSGTESGKLKIS